MKTILIATCIFIIGWIGILITDLSSMFVLTEEVREINQNHQIFKGADVLTGEQDIFVIYAFLPIEVPFEGEMLELHIPVAISETNINKQLDELRMKAISNND